MLFRIKSKNEKKNKALSVDKFRPFFSINFHFFYYLAFFLAFSSEKAKKNEKKKIIKKC